jgi:hypothetical protein
VDVTLNPLSADEMRGETFPVPPAPAQRAARRCARRGASEVPSGPQGSISIKYDHLVVACGCRVSDSVVPGAREHCLRLKDCDDAQQIRVRVGKAFEQASRPGLDDAEKRRLLTFVVVGGGPTGVEIAGEFSDFVRDMAALYPKLKGFASLVLLHGGNALLPMFDMVRPRPHPRPSPRAGPAVGPKHRRWSRGGPETPALTSAPSPRAAASGGRGAEAARPVRPPPAHRPPPRTDRTRLVPPPARTGHASSIPRTKWTRHCREVDVRLNTRVGEVGPRSLLVKVKGTGEEAPLDYGLCVWCAGTEPQPFTANLLDKLPGSARAEDGRVVVDQWLRVEGAGKVGSVMVLGDAAYVLDRAEPLPQTAQVRSRLARETARLREVTLPLRAHVCARAAAARRSPPRRAAPPPFPY